MDMDIQSLPDLLSEPHTEDINEYSEDSVKSNFENVNVNLEKRLGSLKGMMEDLRVELSKEKELWKKEVEEAAKYSYYAQAQTQEQLCNCCADDDESVCSNSEPTLSDVSILDYEQKLNVYQQALAKAHAEKRMQIRRHLAASAYKRKLMELENMCNLELQKVKQNVQILQPLQAMASEWTSDEPQQAVMTGHMDDELTGGLGKKDPPSQQESLMELESFGNKLSSEIKDLAACISPVQSTGTSSSLQDDDDELMLRRLQSVGWYWYNDKNNYPFNPLM